MALGYIEILGTRLETQGKRKDHDSTIPNQPSDREAEKGQQTLRKGMPILWSKHDTEGLARGKVFEEGAREKIRGGKRELHREVAKTFRERSETGFQGPSPRGRASADKSQPETP